ncbi:hypothetical protein I302_107134 [Kwoniella bestiolae CBS 10118]|uniref:Uncharacterized protein n=1 Tax=Kwoniella bestiolae CBS 10118 TaxID=1296100 RepID=A0A1B9FZE6_9TREE|nr:hypothetical protein I302_05600 [Kwoniella bestiolae CBS 10118]OCF24142.1 hypothetical protein I302_05600 [Kwoniella bestiolae CBS 10118]
MTIPGLIPSSFLPPLPRSQYTLSPLHPADILARISILKELYLPPIHGGFTSTDVFEDEEPEEKIVRSQKRERRFSAGLVETMESIGLGLDVPLDSAGNGLEVLEEEERSDVDDDVDGVGEDEGRQEHLDPFEREWAEKWLGGVVRRSQGWIEENDGAPAEEVREVEMILRDATAVLAMMAGTSAAGSLTRHLVFPLLPSLAPALSSMHSRTTPNPNLSPETNMFLSSLSTSPTSPKNLFHRQSISSSSSTQFYATSPTRTTFSGSGKTPRKGRKSILPILLHDAPMSDHLSVGVQTWGSAILLGRKLALNPQEYGLFLPPSPPAGDEQKKGIRVLELGAGTGLLSILCRKLLDLRSIQESTPRGLVVATDFLESVLDNLKICVDLNFPPEILKTPGSSEVDLKSTTDTGEEEGIHIAKLDWTTFPSYIQSGRKEGEGDEEMSRFIRQEGFDLVLASDCVYDETHARLLREVAGWTLRLPDEHGEGGGTFHILSPLRPTFAPELESIDTHFPPLSTYAPLSKRREAAATSSDGYEEVDPDLRGEGLGLKRGLKLGVRGEGKRGVKGKKGEGRVDEEGGYWWWEVGWG